MRFVWGDTARKGLRWVWCVCLMATLVGCSDAKPGKGDVSGVKAEMEKQGWGFVETLGEPGEFTARVDSDSATGRTITAFWATNGQRNQKVYQQTSNLYAVVSFQKGSGDVFAMVFSKARP